MEYLIVFDEEEFKDMKEVLESKATYNRISERFEHFGGKYSLTLSRIEFCVLVINMRCWKRQGAACRKLFQLGDAQDENFRYFLQQVETDLGRGGMNTF